MEKGHKERNRCSRWQIYSYIIHLIEDNTTIQGKRKGFRLKNTHPENYAVSFSCAFRILKDLSEAGIFTRLENHRRMWRLSEWHREKLSRVEFEQRKVIAQRVIDAVRDDIVLQIKANPDIRNEVLASVGFTPSEMKQFRLIERR